MQKLIKKVLTQNSPSGCSSPLKARRQTSSEHSWLCYRQKQVNGQKAGRRGSCAQPWSSLILHAHITPALKFITCTHHSLEGYSQLSMDQVFFARDTESTALLHSTVLLHPLHPRGCTTNGTSLPGTSWPPVREGWLGKDPCETLIGLMGHLSLVHWMQDLISHENDFFPYLKWY